MIKAKASIEIKINERLYQFICDNDAPLGELHDSLFMMKQHIIKMMQEKDPSPVFEEKKESCDEHQ